MCHIHIYNQRPARDFISYKALVAGLIFTSTSYRQLTWESFDWYYNIARQQWHKLRKHSW